MCVYGVELLGYTVIMEGLYLEGLRGRGRGGMNYHWEEWIYVGITGGRAIIYHLFSGQGRVFRLVFIY